MPKHARMHLAEDLRRRLATEPSLFRAQLLREDTTRLDKLSEMARAHEDLESFVKAGLYAGWTQGDLRTHEIKDTILPLLAAVHAYEVGGRTDAQDKAARDAWDAFDRDRLAKLLGCLRSPLSPKT